MRSDARARQSAGCGGRVGACLAICAAVGCIAPASSVLDGGRTDSRPDGYQGAPPFHRCDTAAQCNSSQSCLPGSIHFGPFVGSDAGKAIETPDGAAAESDADSPEAGDGATQDTASEPVEPTSMVCVCLDSNCPSHSHCDYPSGGCVHFDCDQAVPCDPEQSFCNYRDEKCHSLDGTCLVRSDCPDLTAWLSPEVSVSCGPPSAMLGCDVSPASSPGKCQLNLEVPCTPAPPQVPRTLEFRTPDGMTFPTAEQVVFEYGGSNNVTFLFVSTSVAPDAATFAQQAIWGAVSPETPPSSQLRMVRWSDGRQVADGAWQDGAGEPPMDTDLFAGVYAVDGDNIVQVGGPLLRFRVGQGWAKPFVACFPNGPPGPEVGCVNPTVAMACVGGLCEQLCLTDSDCTDDRRCSYDATPGVGIRYCQ